MACRCDPEMHYISFPKQTIRASLLTPSVRIASPLCTLQEYRGWQVFTDESHSTSRCFCSLGVTPLQATGTKRSRFYVTSSQGLSGYLSDAVRLASFEHFVHALSQRESASCNTGLTSLKINKHRHFPFSTYVWGRR